MRSTLLCVALTAFLAFGLAEGRRSRNRAPETESKAGSRESKYLSLFNIVTFKNYACTSTAAGTNGNRRGSCLTERECTNRGGTVNGQCAAGFGVCCTFVVNSGTVSQNCTYIQNTGFPSALSTTGNTVSYTVNKCSCNVCRLRLDFDTFNIQGPANSLETGGGTCTDTFTQSTTTQTNFPVICGLNTGEHIYLDMGGQCTDTATLTFAIAAATSNNRMWDIKVSQIECGTNYDPGAGCYQYYSSTSGQIRTFNFQNADQTHLANQDYNVCVRQGNGFSCIVYTPCTDANSFTLNQLVGAGIAVTAADASCGTDFISIQGATATCCTTPNANQVSRICGNTFSTATGTVVKGVTALPHTSVCDCTPPFNLGIRTDATADADLTQVSRGVCLNYQQVTCP